MAKKSLKLPEVRTHDEDTALLQPRNKRYPTGMRNLCMIKVMLGAGLRGAEVLKLPIQDIDWNSGKLKVLLVKGKMDRILCHNEDTLHLQKPWRERRPFNTDLLFPTL